jgi:hypothetical protein
MYYWIISTLHENDVSLARGALNIDDYTPLPGEARVYAPPKATNQRHLLVKMIGLPRSPTTAFFRTSPWFNKVLY